MMYHVFEEGCIKYRKLEAVTHWRGYRNWQIWVNRGWRDAVLTDQVDNKFFFEYEMPSGKVYAASVEIDRKGEFSPFHKNLGEVK